MTILMVILGILMPFIGIIAFNAEIMWLFWIAAGMSILGLITGTKKTFGGEVLFALGLGIWGDYDSFIEGFGMGLLIGDCVMTAISLILIFIGIIKR